MYKQLITERNIYFIFHKCPCLLDTIKKYILIFLYSKLLISAQYETYIEFEKTSCLYLLRIVR